MKTCGSCGAGYIADQCPTCHPVVASVAPPSILGAEVRLDKRLGVFLPRTSDSLDVISNDETQNI